MNKKIPRYTTMALSPRRNHYALCIFVLNEGDRIRRQLHELRKVASLVDIIIADGGSNDDSLDPTFLLENSVSTLLIKTGPGRLSAQMRMALSYVLDRGYDGAIVMDGNNKDDVSAVPAFISSLDAGVDHVQGSRYIPGGEGINTPTMRHWGVRLIHAPLIARTSGFKYTDTTNGFRGYSRQLLEHPAVQPFRDCFNDYELHYYLAIRAAELGMNVAEIPVARRYPDKGRTPTKISPIRGNLAILRALYRAVTHQFDPEDAT